MDNHGSYSAAEPEDEFTLDLSGVSILYEGSVRPEDTPSPGQSHDQSERPGADGLSTAHGRKVTAAVTVLARVRNQFGEGYSALVRFTDLDGKEREDVIPAEDFLPGNERAIAARLASKGMDVCKTQDEQLALSRALRSAYGRARTGLAPDKCGWHEGEFILPDQVIGSDMVVSSANMPIHMELMKARGHLEDWQSMIGREVSGNPLLIFGVCIAFAAPLLTPLGKEGGGFNFYGETSKGKTTLLQVIASVWRNGAANSLSKWNNTDAGLQSIALAHNDLVLPLDEMSHSDGRNIEALTYILGDGVGRGKGSKDGRGQRTQTWKTMVVSSSELTVSEKIQEGGKRRKGGSEVRLIDILADGGNGQGIFTTTHDKTPKAFADDLKAAASTEYGTAGRAFLEGLVDGVCIDDWVHEAHAIVRAFEDLARQPGMSSAVERVMSRFGLVAAGGVLAVRTGVLPINEDDVWNAVVWTFNRWLDQRGTVGSKEAADCAHTLAEWLDGNGCCQRSPHDPDYGIHPVLLDVQYGGKSYLGIRPGAWRDDIFRNQTLTTVNRELAAAGVIHRTDESGGHGYTPKVTVGSKRSRLYLVDTHRLASLT